MVPLRARACRVIHEWGYNNGHDIAIYIHNSICHRVMQVKYEVLFEEACLIEIQLNKGDKLVFGWFYRRAQLSHKDRRRIVNHSTHSSSGK